MSTEDEDKKIIIYHEQWGCMDVNQREVINPIDLTQRVLPREGMFDEGQEHFDEGVEVVLVKIQQIWTKSPDGELDNLLYDTSLARKLTPYEQANLESGFMVNGAEVGDLHVLFNTGGRKVAP